MQYFIHWVAEKLLTRCPEEVNLHILDLENNVNPDNIWYLLTLIRFLTTRKNYKTVMDDLQYVRESLNPEDDEHNYVLLVNVLKRIRGL